MSQNFAKLVTYSLELRSTYFSKTHLNAISLLGSTQGPSILDLLLALAVIRPSRGREEEIGQAIEIPKDVGIANTILNHADGPSLRTATYRPSNVELRRCSPSRGQDERREFGQFVRHDIDPFLQSLHVIGIKSTTDTI